MMTHYDEVRFTPVLSYSNETASESSLFTANSLTRMNKYEKFLNKKQADNLIKYVGIQSPSIPISKCLVI